MLSAIGSDRSRFPLAGIGLLSVVLLTAGCAGKSPLAFLKPKPPAQKIVAANKPASASAAENKSTAKPETLKTKPVEPSSPPLAEAVPAKTKLRKAEPRTPEQLATDPLRPSDRLGPGYWIQLAVHFSAKGGEAAWKTLAARHRSLLGGEAYAVKRVDLGGRGRFYRVLVGPYAARRPAEEKCAQMKSAKVACFLITKRGRVRNAPAAAAPKPPATAFPAAAIKPHNRATPRNAAVTATPAFVKPPPRRRGKATKRKAGTPAETKKRAADLPFQRRDSIPGATK